jgi:DNA-binding SARP family transcriptional activator/predicted ATPase
MTHLHLYLLGAPRVELAGQPVELNRRKVLASLIYLAMTRQPQRRDLLATLFWPDSGQEAARASLRRELHTLTSVLGEGWLESDREQVALANRAPIVVDVEQFRHHLAATRTHGHAPDELCDDCLAPLTAAVELYQGDFLAGFTLSDCPEFDDWQFFQTDNLRRELTGALEKLVRLHREQGAYASAITYARRWLLVDALHEPVHRLLMQLYAWAGQQAAALRQYQECVRLLDEELGVEPEPETAAIFEAIRTRRFPEPDKPKLDKVTRWQDDKVTRWQDDKVISTSSITLSPPHLVTPSPPHNLPPQPTPFIGRGQEVAAILDRLQDPGCRLLTLVGPGGMGKTRLALQAAQTILDSSGAGAAQINRTFADGVFFVPLEAVQTPSGIVTAIVDALGVRLMGNAAPQQQLLAHLRSQRQLLVLDNFEQLLTPAVQPESTALIAALLAAAPGVKVLVTSREALNLREEWFHQIGGLAYPAEVDLANDTAAELDAVQLFVQCAQRVRNDFTLEAAQAPVWRICRLVEGMPLAIELAATWLKALPVTEVAAEIQQGLDILTARYQNLPSRHQSMRVVLEQSWERLTATEQRVLARLAVFQEGFRRPAAEQVAGASLLILSTFVEKSLLRMDATGRYQMHELLRQFAAEKLAETPAAQTEAHAAHCRYYAAWVAGLAEKLTGAKLLLLLGEMKQEAANLRAGWLYAVAPGAPIALTPIGQSAWQLSLFYAWRGWFHEGLALFQATAARLQDEAALATADSPFQLAYGRVLLCCGTFHYYLSDLQETARFCRQSLQRLEQVQAASAHAQRDCGMARQLLGLLTIQRGDYAEAEQHITRSLHLFRAANETMFAAGSQVFLGLLAYEQGEYHLAHAQLTESEAQLAAAGENRYRTVALGLLGRIDYHLHQAQEPHLTARLRENLDSSRARNDPGAVAQSLTQLGGLLTLAAQNDAQRHAALACLQEGLALHQQIGNRVGEATSHSQLGQLLVALADLPAAETHLRIGLSLSYQLQLPKLMLEALGGLAHLRLAAQPQPPSQQESVLTWLRLIVEHPASDWFTRQRARERLATDDPLPMSVALPQDATDRLERIVASIVADTNTRSISTTLSGSSVPPSR